MFAPLKFIEIVLSLSINLRMLTVKSSHCFQLQGPRPEGLTTGDSEEGTWLGAAPGSENQLSGGEAKGEESEEAGSGEWESTGMFLTVDEVQEMMVKEGSSPLDDCDLGDLEEKIFEIRQSMRTLTPKQIVTSSKLSRQFKYCRNLWPRLRATMDFERSTDVSLIPRAMQVEEDLVAVQGEVKSVVAAYNMVLASTSTSVPAPTPPAERAPTSWNPLF